MRFIVVRAKKLVVLLVCAVLFLSSTAIVFWKYENKDTSAQESVPLPIIMYHHMSPKEKRQNEYTVSVKEFESDLQYLKSHGYETVSISQLLSFVHNDTPLPQKPIMITFDDGFESFYVYAYPLLKKYNMCAVMAVVGEYADKFTQLDDHTVDYSYLTWSEIGELGKSGNVEIANHTDSLHKSTSARRGCRINKGENEEAYRRMLKDDLTACQKKIEASVGKTPAVLAYPYGYNCKQSMALIKEMGFSAAFTCEEKINYIRRESNLDYLYRLGRYNRPHGVSSEQFFKKMSVI